MAPHQEHAQPQRHPPRTHTISGELRQIRGYVEATNARICYLSELLSSTSTDEITEIKRGLKKAHRGLEKLETRFQGLPSLKAVVEITQQVWETFTRLRALEDSLRELRERGPDVEMRTGERPVSYVPSGADEAKKRMMQAEEHWDRRRKANETPERNFISGALRAPDAAPSSSVYEDRDGNEASSNEIIANVIVQDDGRISWGSAEAKGSTAQNSNSYLIMRRDSSQRIFSLRAIPRRRIEVLAHICQEEEKESTALHDPDRVRRGSTSGWLVTLAVMSGLEDPRYVLPELACIKIHEVKAMKKWLIEKGYLHRSGGISRIERVLHFIFVLQMGCRLETVAVLFSCSPRQVESSCRDVLEGLLQMHSETELPRTRRWPIYSHLWHICKKYETRHNWAREHYPWSIEDFQKVLITVNLYIGRWRKQGGPSLGGPSLDWGKYVQPGEAE